MWLSRVWRDWRIVVIVKPETILAWHRRGFRLFWAWKRRGRGRPTVTAEVRALIRTMSEANPLWGAPRIHGELLKLGVTVSQAAVAKYMVRGRRPPSQTWRTFLANHATQIMAADFFVVPTITYRLLFVLIILAHDRRRVVHVAVTAHPTAAWTAQQLREAFPEDHAPRYLLHDRDNAFAAVGTTAEGFAIQRCDGAAIPMAKRVRRARDWIDPTGVFGPCGRHDGRWIASHLGWVPDVHHHAGRTWRSTRTRLSVGRSRQTDPSSLFRKSAGSTIDTSAAPRSPSTGLSVSPVASGRALINAFVGVARGLRKVSVERFSQNNSSPPTSVLVVVS